MAASGTIQQAIRTGYRLQIAWTVDSQSVANNTSSVTAKVQLVSTGSSYTINSSASKSGSLTINGTKYTFNFTASLSGNQTKTIFTKTVTVTHGSDGSKTCAFSATCGINVTLSGTYYGNVTASGNGVFDTIPRASTISSVTASVAVNGTNTVTVAISRKASSFTHTVVFAIGSYSKSTTGVGTSTSYAIPTSWLNAIPNATSGTATVTVTTYSGSTKIGSAVSKNFTITVPADVVPTISGVAVADTVTAVYNQFGNMVQSKSKPKFTITAAGVYGSTIKTYKTVFDGKTYTGATPTASIFISKSGSVSAEITVTDSRGRTAKVTKTWTVLPYAAPKIAAFTGSRSLADGTENYDGTYLSALLSFTVSALNGKNTATYSLEYKLKTATAWTVLTSGSSTAMQSTFVSPKEIFSTESSYDIRLVVKDYFTTVTSVGDIPTAFTLLDFNASGRGLAFGKVSELAEGVEFALPAFFSHAETPSSVTYLATGQDLDAVLEPGFYAIPSTAVSGSLVNKPWTSNATGALMVMSEGNAGQRVQIAFKGTKGDGCIYERTYYSSAWGAWATVHNGGNKILWSGGMYMTAGHIISFSEPASKQTAGIVLVFSEYYDGEVKNQTFSSHFVHKATITAHSGTGHSFWMSTSNGAYIGTKYLYIRDDGITGHNNNNLTFEASGITLTNNRFVLRYVIGV
jgi:hypothetical protein